jgi:hypothetical protein
MLRSNLEVLGIPKEMVENLRAAGSLDTLLAIAESNFKTYSRHYHPDRNSDAGAASLYTDLVDAIADLRSPDGMQFAVSIMVGEDDRQHGIRRASNDRQLAQQSNAMQAMLSLLQHIDQFEVLGITEPTTCLLQLGASRTILEVKRHNSAKLYLTTQEDDVLPEQTESAMYVNGQWSETYMHDEGTLSKLTHEPSSPQQVTVVGFVPAGAASKHAGQHFRDTSDFGQLNVTVTSVTVQPVWSTPEQAWYLECIEPQGKYFSNVVVRNRAGKLALAGVIQAKAGLL